MPLLWWLRDHAGLTGTKFGCGMGVCGACTVQLDGVPVRSCQVPLAEVGRRRVRTIEGLSADGAHPVQRAWRELRVPQCGWCQSGQMMTCEALLRAHPHPTRAQAHAALAGHVCRCGTYARIEQAVQRAAELAGGGAGPKEGA
jgi:isoquinoline 1-oxidoreductase alpha subunit